MKRNLILVAVIFTGILFSSCNNDDDANTESPSPTIVGVWLTTSGNTEEFTNNVSEGTTTNTYDADNYSRITFNTDNTFIDYSSNSFMQNGEVVVEESTDPGIYSINGNTLSISYDGDSDIENVEFSLSATKLITVYTDEYTDANNDVRKYIGTTTFTRQ